MNYGYARVSTAEQNLTLQTEALSDCCRIFSDKSSGALASRPALDELLSIISKGDTITVWKIDRLGRSVPHLASLITELHERGVHIRSIQEGFDTSGSLGRFMFTMLAGLAELERENIAVRCEAGRKSALARGVKFGRKQRFSASQRDLIRQLKTEGKSYGELARLFQASKATIHSIVNL